MKTKIMGILNVTPDSFADGGLYTDEEQAIKHAKQMIKDGADIIDIGGESTRPASTPITEEQELQRVLPIIKALKDNITLSIDTYKPAVANAAIEAGADMINDITGLTNPVMIQVASKHKCPVIIMHMQNTPQNMQNNPEYEGVTKEIKHFFQQQIEAAKKAGIDNLILDPGIGFGKTLQHNLQILNNLELFKGLKYPILIGTSRKSFIEKLTQAPVQERLPGTIAANTLAIQKGATIIRVHDVKEAKQAIEITEAINNG
jgi:dihydropteroate synthase|tara:strand:+ start:1663 stop:2442 length:780 start_codon:yes stop_codon:yes gene_type:complete